MSGSYNQTANDAVNLENAEPQKIPYPKRVFLIIGNEFCERFNFYGMIAILPMYSIKLGYTENEATLLIHTFGIMVYFMCFFGAIISDTWLGKFNTILYLSLIYSVGSVIVSLGALPFIDLSPKIALLIGLILIALGSGGIKPCVSAFGGDQFKLPEQAAQVATYFSLFYFSVNAGALLSSTFTPILRADVHCFGENDCYSLAFGVPAVLMIIAIVCFLIGKSSYTYVEVSSENMIVKMYKCIKHAFLTKRRLKKTDPRKNFLDYSVDKFGVELVNDTKIMLKICFLYLPLPLFWTLFSQQGSRWIFQAAKMNGDMGYFTIKPDQLSVINPLLILTFIPSFEAIVYPLLSKIGLGCKLHRLTIGGVLAGSAFLLSAFLEFWIELSPQNSVPIFWQVPQCVVITMAEVMFSITGLSFSYEHAPESMRSVVQSLWLLTVAIGNAIIVAVSGMQFFQSRAYEFILFAVLMFIDMFIFTIIARNFKNTTRNKIEPVYIQLDTIENKESYNSRTNFSERCHGEKNNVVYEMAKDKNLLDNGTKNKGLGTMQNEDLTFLISLFGLELCSSLEYDVDSGVIRDVIVSPSSNNLCYVSLERSNNVSYFYGAENEEMCALIEKHVGSTYPIKLFIKKSKGDNAVFVAFGYNAKKDMSPMKARFEDSNKAKADPFTAFSKFLN